MRQTHSQIASLGTFKIDIFQLQSFDIGEASDEIEKLADDVVANLIDLSTDLLSCDCVVFTRCGTIGCGGSTMIANIAFAEET